MARKPPRAGKAVRAIGPEWRLFTEDRETDDVELAEWGRRHVPGFLGVIPRQDFANTFSTPASGRPGLGTTPAGRMIPGSSCILNLDIAPARPTRDEPGYGRGGTHWVGVRVAASAPLVFYFDSFGLPPPNEVVVRAYLDGRGVSYPDVQYQQFSEVNCGPRALAVLYTLARAKNELEAWRTIGQV